MTFDAETYEAGLRTAISAGKVNLLNTLVFERNRAQVITMPTLEAFSYELNNAEAEAAAKLQASADAAPVKIAIIEKIMAERGESSQTFICKSCGQHRATRNCQICYKPSEY